MSSLNTLAANFTLYTYTQDDWVYTEDAAVDRLLRHFQTKSLKGYGIHELNYGVIASGAILHYLDLTQHTQVQHVTALSRIEEDKYVWLDRFTIRNLELFGSINEGAKMIKPFRQWARACLSAGSPFR